MPMVEESLNPPSPLYELLNNGFLIDNIPPCGILNFKAEITVAQFTYLFGTVVHLR